MGISKRSRRDCCPEQIGENYDPDPEIQEWGFKISESTAIELLFTRDRNSGFFDERNKTSMELTEVNVSHGYSAGKIKEELTAICDGQYCGCYF